MILNSMYTFRGVGGVDEKEEEEDSEEWSILHSIQLTRLGDKGGARYDVGGDVGKDNGSEWEAATRQQRLLEG